MPKPFKCTRCQFKIVPPARVKAGFDYCLICAESIQRVIGVREFGHKGESTINIFPGDQAAAVKRAHSRKTYGSNMRKFR